MGESWQRYRQHWLAQNVLPDQVVDLTKADINQYLVALGQGELGQALPDQ